MLSGFSSIDRPDYKSGKIGTGSDIPSHRIEFPLWLNVVQRSHSQCAHCLGIDSLSDGDAGQHHMIALGDARAAGKDYPHSDHSRAAVSKRIAIVLVRAI